jgi:hypothetical protein
MDLGRRFDLNHLTREAGNELTGLVAEAVAAHLKEHGER